MIRLTIDPKSRVQQVDPRYAQVSEKIEVSANAQRNAPTKNIVTFFVYRAGSPRVAADYFASEEGKWFEDTSISLALSEPLDEARLEELRQKLEANLNALVEEKYSWFIEIVQESCVGLNAFGVVGHSSYVPS